MTTPIRSKFHGATLLSWHPLLHASYTTKRPEQRRVCFPQLILIKTSKIASHTDQHSVIWQHRRRLCCVKLLRTKTKGTVKSNSLWLVGLFYEFTNYVVFGGWENISIIPSLVYTNVFVTSWESVCESRGNQVYFLRRTTQILCHIISVWTVKEGCQETFSLF